MHQVQLGRDGKTGGNSGPALQLSDAATDAVTYAVRMPRASLSSSLASHRPQDPTSTNGVARATNGNPLATPLASESPPDGPVDAYFTERHPGLHPTQNGLKYPTSTLGDRIQAVGSMCGTRTCVLHTNGRQYRCKTNPSPTLSISNPTRSVTQGLARPHHVAMPVHGRPQCRSLVVCYVGYAARWSSVQSTLSWMAVINLLECFSGFSTSGGEPPSHLVISLWSWVGWNDTGMSPLV
ncbi:hypothetical protein FB45DRAFT_1085687 [Roridomyces roridus]|uniref:Uncharacterized protein n=1 Tax=Roridomyces roridus TaxID=1738132 RepID=A0AAD7F5Y6_9AGAR|nr:hypothetical protein FB45DRAFT_1085687 [Roridomyces roridus]